MVNFCEKCGSLLSPNRQDDGTMVLYCTQCKEESKEAFKNDSYQIKSKIAHDEKDKTTVIEEEFDVRPIIRVACPKCNNAEARYWEAEDRKKEEWETTVYYKCTSSSCGWVWSE
ncbi:MAG: RPA12/RPB9/RPC11 RNA polymerase family protein [Candidatus Hodarchaeales archaeon]|jgi:DNA-directed RNA polymerase subunit M